MADAHVNAEERLRRIVTTAVTGIWRSLPGYDRENVDEWLSKVVPVVLAGRRQSVALTNAYLARSLERPPLGIDIDKLVASLRNGAPVGEVYERPFVTMWSSLGEGSAYATALSAGLARATSTAAMDMQLAMRATASAVQEADSDIYGYQRVADAGACDYCAMIDGAYVKSADAFPIHNNCGCGLEPLTSPHPRAAKLPDGVSVHDHGELGAVLADPSHAFSAL